MYVTAIPFKSVVGYVGRDVSCWIFA